MHICDTARELGGTLNRATGAAVTASLAQQEAVMWKAVLTGVSAITIAGSSIVYVSSGFSQEDRPRSADAAIASRLASYKERPRLTPEQEKNWPAYESALEALVKQRRERMEKRHEEVRPSEPTQRMRQRAEALSGMGAALSRLADAQQPLYNSLDEGQRRRFATLSQILGDHSDMRRRSPDREYDDDRRGWRGRDSDYVVRVAAMADGNSLPGYSSSDLCRDAA
jgi:hypothetical protein